MTTPKTPPNSPSVERVAVAPGAALPVRASGWRVRAQRTAYDNPWIGVEHHDVIRPDGAAGIYGVVRMKHVATGILPVHDDGSVTLVGQYRFAVGRYSWEAPEGGARLDEDPRAAVQRELAEEAGLKAGVLVEAGSLDVSNCVCDERAELFVGYDLSPVPFAPDGDEELAVTRLAFADALDRVLSGELRDALTVVLMLRAYHMAQEGVLPGDLVAAMLGRDRSAECKA